VIEPWADAPLKDPSDDKLDRQPFVKTVASLIGNLADSNDSTVLGLVGPWGSGKTTVLHYIARELDSSVKVVKFNPWSFDDDVALQSELYSAILEAFPKGSHRNIRTRATGLLSRGAPALKALPEFGGAASEALTALLPTKSWDSDFKALAKAIRQASVKVLVLVDDVDRLQPKELLLLMKTVRLLGRFPRVNYLLAFDRNSTINTLRIALGTERPAAEDYLEKIVQYPLDLPAPQQRFLQGIVLGHLNPILDETSARVFDVNARERFESFYRDHMWTTLVTPRACHRYALQAKTFLALTGGNVDAADFFALTFLRLFFPDLYNKLPLWKERLTVRQHGEKTSPSEWLRLVETCGYTKEVAGDLVDMIAHIFPRSVPSEFASFGLGGSYRAFDQEYFDRYFNFSLPVGDVSDIVVKRDLVRIMEGEVPVGATCADTFDHPVPDIQMLAVRKGKRHTPYETDTSRLVHFLSSALSRDPLDYHSVADPAHLKLGWLEQLLERQQPWAEEELDALIQRIERPAVLGVVLTRVAALYSDHARATKSSKAPQEASTPAASFADNLATRWTPFAASWLVSEWQRESADVSDQEILDVWNSIASLQGLSHLQEQTAQALRRGGISLSVLASEFVFPARLVADYRAPAGDLFFDIAKLVASVPMEVLASGDLGSPEILPGLPDGPTASRNHRIRIATEGLLKWRADRAAEELQQRM
jgi:hypothetical protein